MKKFGKPVTLPVVKAKIPFIFILGFVVIVGGVSILKRKEIKSFVCNNTSILKNSSICSASAGKIVTNDPSSYRFISPNTQDYSIGSGIVTSGSNISDSSTARNLMNKCPICHVTHCPKPGDCECIPDQKCRDLLKI